MSWSEVVRTACADCAAAGRLLPRRRAIPCVLSVSNAEHRHFRQRHADSRQLRTHAAGDRIRQKDAREANRRPLAGSWMAGSGTSRRWNDTNARGAHCHALDPRRPDRRPDAVPFRVRLFRWQRRRATSEQRELGRLLPDRHRRHRPGVGLAQSRNWASPSRCARRQDLGAADRRRRRRRPHAGRSRQGHPDPPRRLRARPAGRGDPHRPAQPRVPVAGARHRRGAAADLDPVSPGHDRARRRARRRRRHRVRRAGALGPVPQDRRQAPAATPSASITSSRTATCPPTSRSPPATSSLFRNARYERIAWSSSVPESPAVDGGHAGAGGVSRRCRRHPVLLASIFTVIALCGAGVRPAAAEEVQLAPRPSWSRRATSSSR